LGPAVVVPVSRNLELLKEGPKLKGEVVVDILGPGPALPDMRLLDKADEVVESSLVILSG
jgi:hypothetical protein